jgi:hypothetical protein
VSGVQDLIAIYRELSRRCDYPLHLGLTEAGMGSKGIVASTAAMAVLLQEGIGDTIRVSLTPEPGGKRTQEVIVAQEMLQTMGLRAFTPMVVACPGCGRTTSTFFQELAQSIQEHVRQRMPQWRSEYDGVENMTLAVMGCVVNGPGESKHANIGISLPGTGEVPAAPVFEDGAKTVTLRGEHIAEGIHRHRRCLRGAHLPEKVCRLMMTPKIQSVRGMNDILPDEAEFWDRFEEIIRSWLKSYGYRPIRLPIVEPTPLFKRAIGEVTDIVEKEMYSFVDSLNGEAADAASRRHRRLRARRDPAQSDRAAAAAALLHGPDVPPRAAAERALSPVPPGRRRSARLSRPDIDAEQILMGARLWDDLGLDGIALQLNTLGQPERTRAIAPS